MQRTPRTALVGGLAAAALAALLPAVPTTAPITAGLAAQTARERGTSAAALRFRQLDGVKRVLMIAAHPDDEDTSLLAALARGTGAQTAYLSLTRGEGGQNLIGPRLHEGLGIVRTGELVAARALDGGSQYFTRAFDFGYSKTIDETLSRWPMDEVLRDAVYVVRSFRPQVIVSVFSGTTRDGHGHHQAAGVIARRAFEAAGDPDRFPKLARHAVTPWTPAKLYRSARFSPDDATVRVPTGNFDPVLGRSHFQIAMESRSYHRSQDMGSGQSMGPRDSPLQLIASSSGAATDTRAEDGIFAGVDTTLFGQLPSPLPETWPADTEARLARYHRSLAEAGERLSAFRSDNAVPPLLQAANILQELVEAAPQSDGRRVLERRLDDLAETAVAAASVVVDVRASRGHLTPGETFIADAMVWNGGNAPLRDVDPRLILPEGWVATPTSESAMAPSRSFFFRRSAPNTPDDGHVLPGTIARWSWSVTVPRSAAPSVPYYLEKDRNDAMYRWPDDASRWALPFGPAPVQASVSLTLAPPEGSEGRHALRREGMHVSVDKALGEYREAVLVLPALNVEVQPTSMVWPAGEAATRELTVALANTSSAPRTGSVRLAAPPGWRTEPSSAPYSLEPGSGASFAFRITPDGAAPAGKHQFRASAEDQHGTRFATTYDVVSHPHIRRAALFRPAAAEVRAFPVAAASARRVGYIMGSGDGGATALRQMGMTVDVLDPQQVRDGSFDDYDVLVLGVRAYETRPDLAAANDAVLDFARAGGTVIVQYNKYEYPQGGFSPFPVSMNRPHDRVTDENARVTIVSPKAPVFTSPNTIGPSDFDGWTQERGLYFLSEWDDRFVPLLELADPGEEPKRGGLLVAPLGEGLYVYTGLAFFRQFQAGVPGAYRLFANLVSLTAEEWERAMGRPVS